MPTLSITKTYLDTQVLNEVDLDNIKNSVETFMNITKIDNVNIQTGGIATANYADLSVTTLKLAADAVTAVKLDETEAFEMISLRLGAAGPLLSREGATTRVLIQDAIRFAAVGGPLLSRVDATTRLLIESSLRVGSAAGPILSEDTTKLQISSNVDIDGNTITLDDDGNTIQLIATANNALGINDSSDTRTAIVSNDAAVGLQLQCGTESGTSDGGGLLEKAVVFSEAFKVGSTPTVVLTDIGANDAQPVNKVKTATITNTGFTWRVVAAATTLFEMNYLAEGTRDDA